MITKEELKEYAKVVSLNLGQAEKDYFQNILLFIIYQDYGKGIVFKGGTALKKCFGLNRFSEDLDFTCLDKIDIKKVKDGLKRFRVEFELESEVYENGLKIILRIKGPLYVGIRQSLCKVIIDFSFRETVILKPEIKTIGRFLEEVPSFDVFVMQEREILAEKIRAMLARTKARDVYDLWFLARKGVNIDKEIVNEKLKYYNIVFDEKELIDCIKKSESVWEEELGPLVSFVPDFKSSFNEIKESLKL